MKYHPSLPTLGQYLVTRRPKGFALIATLTLLSLMALIAIGLLSLSSIESRRSGLGAARDEARANARLALMVAIGQLQRTLGPDNSISATALVGRLEPEDSSLDAPNGKMGLRNYVGVWRAAENPRDEEGKFQFVPPVYANDGLFEDSSLFQEWLVSNTNSSDTDGTNDQGFFGTATGIGDIAFNNDERGGEPVTLVGEGSVDQPAEYVRAGTVAVYEDELKNDYAGRYAYWVGDNNMKAYVKATDPDVRENADRGDLLVKAATPGVNGIESFASLNDGRFEIEGNTEEVEKVFGLNQLELINGFDEVASRKNFHDLTASADSLLVNTTAGGLRKDLSLYFGAERPAAGGRWDGEILERNPPLGPYGQNALSEHDEFDTGSWATLRQHSRLHQAGSLIRNASGDGNVFRSPRSNNEIDSTSDYSNVDYPNWNSQKRVIAPVILRTTMLLSAAAEDLNRLAVSSDIKQAYGAAAGTVRRRGRISELPQPNNRVVPRPASTSTRQNPVFTSNHYVLNFAALPIVTLWNPYNVPIQLPDGFAVRLDGTGTILDVEVQGNTLQFEWAASSFNGNGRRFVASGLAFVNQRNFVIAPGATATFTADTTREPIDRMGRARFFSAVNVTSPADLGNAIGHGGEFIGGYITNSLFAGARFNNDGSAPGTNPDFTPLGQLSGFTADLSDVVTINVKQYVPWGESELNTGNPFRGLLGYEQFHSIGSALIAGVTPATNFNNFWGREGDSAKNIASIAWRSDPGNSVYENGGLIGQTQITVGNMLNQNRHFFAAVDVRMKALDIDGNDQKGNSNATWLHNIPHHQFSGLAHFGTRNTLNPGSAGNTTLATESAARPYTAKFQMINGDAVDVFDSLYQIDPNDGFGTYFGKSYSEGVTRAVSGEIPLAPLQSIAQLMHVPMVPIDASRWSNLGAQNYAISNSYASPMLQQSEIAFPEEHPNASQRKSANYEGWKIWLTQWVNKSARTWRGDPDLDNVRWATADQSRDWTDLFTPLRFIDRSYVGNTLLWDDFFFSGISDYNGDFYSRLQGSGRNSDQVMSDFVSNGKGLPNPTYRYNSRGFDASEVETFLEDEQDGYKRSAEHIVVEGGFNVNSTSVKAWRAFLASNLRKDVPKVSSDGAIGPSFDESTEDEYIVSRFTFSPEGGDDPNRRWTQPVSLTSEELDDLAEKIVIEVAERGPFRSIAEFVNRRVSDTDEELALKGALQAALDNSTVNEEWMDESQQVEISGTDYRFPKAAEVSRYAGSPEFVMQGDLLNSLGPAIQARSDSFMIRAYGESADGRAKAWCEAQVSRSVDYVDSEDEPHLSIDELSSEQNKLFGRQFKVLSFRWLDASEV